MTPKLDFFKRLIDFTATKMDVFMVYGLTLEIPHLTKFSLPSYSSKSS